MTFGRRRPEPFDSAEAAQLQRDIVGTVVHELASITSALSLRVDASPGALGESDVHAIATLTSQLRAATKPLIWLRGSPGRGMLAPTRNIEVQTWWQHTSQVASGLLPHGTRITTAGNGTPAEGNAIPTEDLSIFSMLILATCRHFVDADQSLPVGLAVTLPQVADPHPSISLTLTPISESSLGPVIRRTTRWKRFCLRTAARSGSSLTWWEPVEGTLPTWRWTVTRNGEVS